MIELNYVFKQEGLADTLYQLIRASMEDPWLVLSGNNVLGIIDRVDNCWVQIAGNEVSEAAINGMGNFISKQQFSWLPGLVKKQWLDYVLEVTVISKNNYEVICKENICIKRFKQRFIPGIHALARREEEIVFKVSSFNKSSFYEVTKAPAIDRFV
ncbi:hypothetical protein ASE74_21625 [Pedobacter sp. Leaf216]|uniref:hypothetical protein n=1 Tax=Pedobacter sp. Leaf216 TaxID=1735684 RepID=UPI0006F4C3B7|nr:hypothetical protein [Pedobacter sp. Leaf216]KQM72902.1 hypothetical protein ASE74_21625 [Pedobacter sp. Leaf216]